MRFPEDSVQSQYAASPIIRRLIDFLNQEVDPFFDVSLFYEMIFNIHTAEGYGLDNWGRILGLGRVLQVEIEDYFGFNGSELHGFGQQPFYYPGLTQNYPLDDDMYRRLLLCKAAANICASDQASLIALLKLFFEDRGNMYIIQTDVMEASLRFEFELTAVEKSLLKQDFVPPRPAGVLYGTIEALPDRIFGFNGSLLQPFNEGVFYRGGVIPEPDPEPPEPPEEGDPYFDYVGLLLHYDVGDVDYRGFVVDYSKYENLLETRKYDGDHWSVGVPFIDDEIFKFGTGSLAYWNNGFSVFSLDETNNLGVQFLANSEFTIEFFINFRSNHDATIFSFGIPPIYQFVNCARLNIAVSGGNFGDIALGYYNSTGTDHWSGATAMPGTNAIGVWNHIAMTRDSSLNLRVYVNGILQPTPISFPRPSSTIIADLIGSGSITIGGNRNIEFYGYFDGNIDEFRLTTGVCRYFENFEPPTKAFPNFKA